MARDADVVAAAGGSADAYARLVDGCRGLVASIALAIVRDVPSSEEVAQDVFVRAYRSLPKLRNPNSFLPWLRQLTRNRAHKFLAERGRRPEPVSDEVLGAAADPAPAAEAQLVHAEELRVLADALEALPDEAREILVLYYREGRSVAQVAELLGLREDAAKRRLSRARVRLREDVEAHFARAAERTRPGDDFTAAVIVALPKVALAGAAGAVLKTAGLAVKPFLAALPQLLGGVLALGLGLRKNLGLARDAQERRGLWAARGFMAAAVIAFGLAVPYVPQMAHPKVALVALTAMLMFAIDFGGLFWEPRVMARRLAAESSEDPVAAVERARRRKRVGIISFVVGHVVGSLPVIWYLLR